jgi:hypothetical protein
MSLYCCLFLRLFSKLQKATITFVMYVRLYVRMDNSAPTERILMKLGI